MTFTLLFFLYNIQFLMNAYIGRHLKGKQAMRPENHEPQTIFSYISIYMYQYMKCNSNTDLKYHRRVLPKHYQHII